MSTSDRRTVRGDATKQRLLEAARDLLLERGHQAASTHAVAERAGVRQSLVGYHFGSKQQLLLAVLEHENAALLDRQRELYAASGPLLDKWRRACEFLDEDIRSGYVRVLWELWAAGLADATLRAGWRSAMGEWRRLLETVYAQWADQHDVRLPLSPRAMASLVTNLFQGIEVELLAAVPSDDAPHREILDAIGDLIERIEHPAPAGAPQD